MGPFKAFVLHMRGASLVTVGEFSSPEDPEIERVRRQLALLAPKLRDPFVLLPEPIPVEVPQP